MDRSALQRKSTILPSAGARDAAPIVIFHDVARDAVAKRQVIEVGPTGAVQREHAAVSVAARWLDLNRAKLERLRQAGLAGARLVVVADMVASACGK
jgi:hypothetical protein